jgi:hypothetical protein
MRKVDLIKKCPKISLHANIHRKKGCVIYCDCLHFCPHPSFQNVNEIKKSEKCIHNKCIHNTNLTMLLPRLLADGVSAIGTLYFFTFCHLATLWVVNLDVGVLLWYSHFRLMRRWASVIRFDVCYIYVNRNIQNHLNGKILAPFWKQF